MVDVAHRTEINMLKDIGKICEAQRVRAELEVETLNLELDRLGQRRESENRHLEASEKGWEKAVTGASLQLMASAAWSADILTARTRLMATEDEIRDRWADRQTLCERLRCVSARGDAVEALRDRAERLAARRREDVALEAYPVRVTLGWRASCE